MTGNGNGRLVALVVALSGSLKGVSEIVRAFKAHRKGAPVEYLELVERLEETERQLSAKIVELSECVGAAEPP